MDAPLDQDVGVTVAKAVTGGRHAPGHVSEVVTVVVVGQAHKFGGAVTRLVTVAGKQTSPFEFSSSGQLVADIVLVAVKQELVVGGSVMHASAGARADRGAGDAAAVAMKPSSGAQDAKKDDESIF
ncbi:MAG: hypothetical protein Q9162_005078 [Coniocarpon cinnabarinum]